MLGYAVSFPWRIEEVLLQPWTSSHSVSARMCSNISPFFPQVREPTRPLKVDQVYWPDETKKETIEYMREEFALPDTKSLKKLADGMQRLASAQAFLRRVGFLNGLTPQCSV
jgi:hypothetical protein